MKYAYCLTTMDESILTNSSLDKDGHESAIMENPSCCFDPDVLNRLRLDVLKLVCEVTCKYQSVRKTTSLEENKCNCTTQCDCTINGSPNCNIDWTKRALTAHVVLHLVNRQCLAIRTVHTMLHTKMTMSSTTVKTCTMKNPITMFLTIRIHTHRKLVMVQAA